EGALLREEARDLRRRSAPERRARRLLLLVAEEPARLIGAERPREDPAREIPRRLRGAPRLAQEAARLAEDPALRLRIDALDPAERGAELRDLGARQVLHDRSGRLLAERREEEGGLLRPPERVTAGHLSLLLGDPLADHPGGARRIASRDLADLVAEC